MGAENAMKFLNIPILMAVALTIAACARDEEDKFAGMSANQIYAQGEQALLDGDVIEAAETFAEVERLFPYSESARRSTIMEAYAYNKAREFDKSRTVAERFLSTYPGDNDAAYAQYLVALSYYEQIDRKGRDPYLTTEAISALEAVIEIYPDSEYARSAKLKLDLAVDNLAAKEMEVGRFYLKRQHYGAAINRFKRIVENYGTTTYVPEALHRMVEAYLSLGDIEAAREAAFLLGYNYQGSEWYEDTYARLKGSGVEPIGEGQSDNVVRRIYRRTILGEWL